MRNINLVQCFILCKVNDHTQILKHIDLKLPTPFTVDIISKVTDSDL